ncbi:MAG: hypothetical protein AAFO81_12825 [Pseudomonadota bacterium]
MHDDKHFNWPGDDNAAADSDEPETGAQVFRHWLSRSPATGRRASFDPSIYTWKGYRQWKDGVDKHWIDDKE